MIDTTRARRAYLAVAVVLPLAVTAIAVALQLLWLPQMPDPVAIHWSTAGPDGFGAVWTLAALTAGVGVGLTALLGAMVWASLRAGTWAITQRLIGVMVAGFVVFLAVALTWSAGMQVGLADAAQSPGGLVPQLVGAAVAIPVAVAAWFVLPAGVIGTRGAGESVAPLALGEDERAVWLRTVAAPPALMVLLGAGVLFVLGAGAVVGVDDPAAVLLAVAGLLLAVLTAGFGVLRVRVDRSGLLVRSFLGLPRFRVAAADITGARVIRVAPLGDFGGWGLRGGAGGQFGVIVRGGEALEVERTGRAPFVVTVDDAATAAALLQTVATRT